MGRRPIFDAPLTDAERQRRYRNKQKGVNVMNDRAGNQLSVPAPSDRQALMAQRRNLAAVRNINDIVEDAFVALYDPEKHPRFVSLVTGAWNSDSVEGTLAADDHEAARYIRGYAEKENLPLIPEKKLAALVQALHVVMRRYHLSRSERRVTVNGEQVAMPLDEPVSGDLGAGPAE